MEFRNRILKTLSGVALISTLGLSPVAHAQQVVAPLSPSPAVAERQAAATNQPGITSPDMSSTAAAPKGLRWGPANLRPHFFFRYLYGDGIQASPGNSKKTAIYSFSPGLFAEIGTHWTLDYTPTWNYYSSRAFHDTVDEAGIINWSTKYQEWSLAAAHSYSSTDSPLVETGRQTQQTTHASSFNALYALSSRYALDTTLKQTLRFAKEYNDPREWTIREMVHLQTSPQVDTALGAEYGYTQIDKSPDMSSIQVLGSLTWRPFTQLNMSVQAGLEKRHIYSTPASDVQNPVYTASIQFIPVATTQLSVTASRATSASYLDNQIVDSTQYGFTFQQRLLQRMQFNAAYSHQESEYSATTTSVLSGRKDKTDSINLGLSTVFITRLRTSISYQYRNNSSNTSGFKFTSNQISFEIGYSF
jgi:Putative beta-barrel porin 2